MNRFVLAAALTAIAGSAFGEAEYLGLYMNGAKIGYSEYLSAPAKMGTKSVTRSDSKTIIDTVLLGTPVNLNTVSTSWTGSNGKPLRMTFSMSSAGRTHKVDAVFSAKTVSLAIDNSGQKSQKSLAIPSGTIADDPVALVVAGSLRPGMTKSFYVLDPMTATFLKNEVKVVGKAKASVNGRPFDATLVKVVDPRATTNIYLSGKGDIVKIEGPMGINMLPVSKAVALAPPGKYAPTPDLAYSTSLKTDKEIADPASLASLRIKITAGNVARVPSSDHQTATKSGEAWIVQTHPALIAESTGTIADAAASKPQWLKPSLHIPSNSPRFVSLAKSIVGDRTTVADAATAIHGWVNKEMVGNAGIGILRDATEVLETKEGVCRDYAILTATLLRAAGIPTRVASGLVNWDGAFFYHAWAEAWDGKRWLGIDSTTPQRQISAAHIKLGEGSVEEAFTFTYLERAKVEVLATKRR